MTMLSAREKILVDALLKLINDMELEKQGLINMGPRVFASCIEDAKHSLSKVIPMQSINDNQGQRTP